MTKEEYQDMMILRKFMWVNHGCHPCALYGDDGEMQCGACGLDFKRMSVTKLHESIVTKNLKKYQEQLNKEIK